MYAFIDESGNTGLPVGGGNSRSFGLAMVVLPNSDAVNRLQNEIRIQVELLRASPEFKFSRSKDNRRLSFFQAVMPFEFTVYSVVIDKESFVRSRAVPPQLAFHDAGFGALARAVDDSFADVTIILDDVGDGAFRRSVVALVKSKFGANRVKAVRTRSSHKEPLLQLADMCVGLAVRRADDRCDPSIWNAVATKFRGQS
jgi:hypothetical protein